MKIIVKYIMYICSPVKSHGNGNDYRILYPGDTRLLIRCHIIDDKYLFLTNLCEMKLNVKLC